MATGPKSTRAGSNRNQNNRPQPKQQSNNQGIVTVTTPKLLSPEEAAKSAQQYPDALDQAATAADPVESVEDTDEETQAVVDEATVDTNADADASDTAAEEQVEPVIIPTPTTPTELARSLIGINSGLPQATVEQAGAVLLDNPQRNRERAVSEREKTLHAAIAARGARPTNPVTAAAQAVVQPPKPKDVNVSPEVRSAYAAIDLVMDAYIDAMEPPKALSPETAALQQLAMYRLVKSILTNGGPTMRHSMAYLMMIIKEHRQTTFSAQYALRGLRDMRGTDLEREFWRLLMEMLVAFCEPEGMALRIKRIDIPRLKVAAQRVEGPHNTTLAGNLAIFITQHIRNR